MQSETNPLILNIMKTKQLFRISMVAVCTMFMCGLMTGCKDTDNNTPEDPQKDNDNKAVAAKTEVSLKTNEDMLKLFNISVDFYDNEGKLQNEALTKTEWTRTILSPLPTKAGFLVNFKAKDGIDYASLGQTKLFFVYKFFCSAVNASEKLIGEQHKIDEITFSPTIGSGKIPAWIDTFAAEKAISSLIEFDAEGNSKKISW